MAAPDPFYGTDAWKAARRKALALAGFKCRFCGLSVLGKGKSRVDHIKSKRERPDLALTQSNLRVLCAPCDNARHAEKGGAAPDRGCDAEGNPISKTHHWNK